MSEHNAQQGASPQQAQSVVNVAPGEGPAKPADYDDFVKQLTDLQKQLEDPTADVAALQKQVADLEAEVAKKATKRSLSKKISDMQKQMQPEDDGEDDNEDDEDDSEDDDAEAETDTAEAQETPSVAKHSGKGIVAVDQLHGNALGENYGWFKDLMKANAKARTAFK